MISSYICWIETSLDDLQQSPGGHVSAKLVLLTVDLFWSFLEEQRFECINLLGGIDLAFFITLMTSSLSSISADNQRAKYACCRTQVTRFHISTTSPFVLTVSSFIPFKYVRTILSAFPGGGGLFPNISLGPGRRHWGIFASIEPPIVAMTLRFDNSPKSKADWTAKYPPADWPVQAIRDRSGTVSQFSANARNSSRIQRQKSPTSVMISVAVASGSNR